MLRYQWYNSYKKEKDEPNIPVIGEHNADWVLFQIGREVQLSKLTATRIKNNFMRDWLLPDSFLEDARDKPTYQEADLFEIVMDSFLKFLVEKEKDFISLRNGIIYKKIDFVKSIVKTRILIEDNEVMIYSENIDLIEEIRNRLETSPYKLRTITNQSESKKWWASVTREKCVIS